MIKINKPNNVPKVLLTSGADETKKNCDAFDANQSLFLKNLTIKSNIYGHQTVKKSLLVAQNNKCCFCEKSQVDEYGDVEHFRPKKGYNSVKSQKLIKPGYYWLAYDWNNLFFVCNACNRSHKSNLFPLIDENQRAKNHTHNIDNESPFLINPGIETDIASHLDFKAGQIIGLTERGRRTIKICGLDRSSLNDKRLKHINDVEARIIILGQADKYPPAIVEKARKEIKKYMSSAGEFSAMINVYLRQYNIVITP